MGGNDYLPMTRGLNRTSLLKAYLDNASWIGPLFEEEEDEALESGRGGEPGADPLATLKAEAVLRWYGVWFFTKHKTILGHVDGSEGSHMTQGQKHKFAKDSYQSFAQHGRDEEEQTKLWMEAIQEVGDKIPDFLQRPPCYEDYLLQVSRLQHVCRHFLSAHCPSPRTGLSAKESGWNEDGTLRTHQNKTSNKIFKGFEELEKQKCGCAKGCDTARCSCYNAGLKCSFRCKCSNCKNPAGESSSSVPESSAMDNGSQRSSSEGSNTEPSSTEDGGGATEEEERERARLEERGESSDEGRFNFQGEDSESGWMMNTINSAIGSISGLSIF